MLLLVIFQEFMGALSPKVVVMLENEHILLNPTVLCASGTHKVRGESGIVVDLTALLGPFGMRSDSSLVGGWVVITFADVSACCVLLTSYTVHGWTYS